MRSWSGKTVHAKADQPINRFKILSAAHDKVPIVSSELLFTVSGSAAHPARPITLAEAGLLERAHLQEWILAHPQILGEDVLIVTSEYGQWQSAGAKARADRLDILGLHRDGRLLVAELKRDTAPDTVQMQALKYAAMASRFTVEGLAEEFARFRKGRGTDVDETRAQETLLAHAPELDEETLRRPRIALVAGAFPADVTATAVWLSEMGLDVALLQVQPYRSTSADGHEQVLISVSRIYPVPVVEDFTISPARARIREVEANRVRSRQATAVQRLVAAGSVADGTAFALRVTHRMTGDMLKTVQEWLAEDPARGRAVWHNDTAGPLTWEADGQSYLPTTLVRKIVASSGYSTSDSFEGTVYWFDDKGQNLVDLAKKLSDEAVSP